MHLTALGKGDLRLVVAEHRISARRSILIDGPGPAQWTEYELIGHPWSQWLSVGLELMGHSISWWGCRETALERLIGSVGTRRITLDGQAFEAVRHDVGRFRFVHGAQWGRYEHVIYHDGDALLRFARFDDWHWAVSSGAALPESAVRPAA